MLTAINIYTKNEYGSYKYETKLYLSVIPREREYINVKGNPYDIGAVWRVKLVRHVIENNEPRIDILCTIEKYGYEG